MAFLSRRDLLRYSGAGAAALTSVRLLGAAAPAMAATPAVDGAGAATAGRSGAVFAHVRPRTDAQLALLSRLDDTHTTFDDGAVEVLLWDDDLALLDSVGMDYDLVEPATTDSVRPAGLKLQPGETANGKYRRNSAAYWADLKQLVADHEASGRVRLLTMGTSLLGDTVYGVEIATDVANDDGRPVVMHDGMHHCREWPAGEIPIMWAYDLLENYGTDDVITSIVDSTRTIVLPVVNPDGFDRTRDFAEIAGASSDRNLIGLGFPLAVAGKGDMHRKNLRAVSNEGPLEATAPTVGGSPIGAQQPDAYGIDLNRNYAFHWGDERGSSSVPEDQTYRGQAPFSEPETHNVRDLTLANLPITYITHHTSGRKMLIPWGRNPREIQSPDFPIMATLGREMRDGFVGPDGKFYEGNGYVPSQAFNLYATSGTSRDWGHASGRAIIFTFEHGVEFHGTYASTIPAMYEQNRGALIRHSLAAMDESIYARITGAGPAGGSVEVTKSFTTPTYLQLSPEDPPMDDPTNLRARFVDEEVRRVVRIGSDGSFDIKVPPSTRPYLVNEKLLEEFEEGAHEAYTVNVLDAAGQTQYSVAVTVDRGRVAAISADVTEVIEVNPVDTTKVFSPTGSADY